jgi:hypothetical protein
MVDEGKIRPNLSVFIDHRPFTMNHFFSLIISDQPLHRDYEQGARR